MTSFVTESPGNIFSTAKGSSVLSSADFRLIADFSVVSAAKAVGTNDVINIKANRMAAILLKPEYFLFSFISFTPWGFIL